MGLLSLFRTRGDAGSGPLSADDVARARTRARQRLIGAVILLGLGVIGFPLVFETQPRPIPVDLPIEIPRKDAVPPLALPPPRQATGSVTSEKAPEAETPAAKPADNTAAKPAESGAAKPVDDRAAKAALEPRADAPVGKPAPAPRPAAPPANDGARAKALLEGQPVAKADDSKPAEAKADDSKPADPKPADANGRFVVQVGAFSDAALARETRAKVEKLGLKTYTQVVETDAGRRIRIRVGPFASREEADKTAAKIKSAGLPSATLGL
jgi:DedD protein